MYQLKVLSVIFNFKILHAFNSPKNVIIKSYNVMISDRKIISQNENIIS